jgi:hypothetical protein
MIDNSHILYLDCEIKCQQDFLGRLNTQLKRGHVAYKNYFSQNKIFLHARLLKVINNDIRKLILSYCHVLPSEQQSYAIELVSHIDIWSALWDDYYDRLSPKIMDEFSFENNFTFPEKAVDSLLSYYSDITEKLTNDSEFNIKK